MSRDFSIDAPDAAEVQKGVLVVSRRSGDVETWSLDGARLSAVKSRLEPLYRVCCHPVEDAMIAIGAGDVEIWRGGQITAVLPGGEMQAAAFTPDGNRLWLAAADETVRVYRWPNLELEATLTGGERNAVFAFHESLTALAASWQDGSSIRLFRDLARDNPPIPRQPDTLYGIAFSPDGHWLAVVDGALAVYDVAKRRCRAAWMYEGDPLEPPGDDFAPSQCAGPLFTSPTRVVIGAPDGHLRTFDVTASACVSEVAVHDGPILALAQVPDGLLSVGREGAVRFTDVVK